MKGNLEVINSFCKMFSRLDVGESGLYDSEESCLVQPLHHAPKVAKYWRASSVSACFYLLSHVVKMSFRGRKCFDERQMGPWNDSNHTVKCPQMRLWNASYCGVFCIKLRCNRTWIAHWDLCKTYYPLSIFSHILLEEWIFICEKNVCLTFLYARNRSAKLGEDNFCFIL